MRALESLRRVAAVVILGASASLLVAGCAEYYPQDVDTSGYTAEWNASQNAAQAARIEAARPTPEQIKAREAAASRAICVEGSMAECEAACDGGRLAMCVTLAQELHSGARVTADPERADRVLARACDGGRLDACLQRGVWLTSSDADEAAELFMRGCEAQRTDSVTTTMSCGLWMTLLDQHVYEPNDGDEYSGLSRICALEQSGALTPGSTLTDGSIIAHYVGGACGRLKDLGMSAGSSLNRDLPQKQAPNTAALNPYAPKW